MAVLLLVPTHPLAFRQGTDHLETGHKRDQAAFFLLLEVYFKVIFKTIIGHSSMPKHIGGHK